MLAVNNIEKMRYTLIILFLFIGLIGCKKYDSEIKLIFDENELKTQDVIINFLDSVVVDYTSIENLKKAYPELTIIPCSADSELALREASKSGLIDYVPGEDKFEIKKDLNEKQKSALETIKKNVLKVYGNTGVQQILNSVVFDLLDYIAVFPAGGKLTDSKGNVLPD